MVKLNTIIAANAASIKQQPLVAVFVGATNGIGEYTVRELCKTHGSDGRGLEIFLLARNATTAQSIIAQCASECSRVNFHFVQIGDISLLQSVDTACEQVLQILNESNNTDEVSGRPRIDLLVMSQGKVEFGARQGRSRLTTCRLSG
jgi:NAD(P)-dependent dehydrogenase (short-subunit alcohol dehydrogenase family)